MNTSISHRIFTVALAALIATGAYSQIEQSRIQAMHTLPPGLSLFKLSDSPPACDRWKQHMPATRDPDVFRLYITARKLWRSKVEYQLTREETQKILDDVSLAAKKGDWGARALLSLFYRQGLGPYPANNVLQPDAFKTVALSRMAAEAGQPWGLYDLGVAHEYGYGGAVWDEKIAWAYFLKAAQLGSPDGQLTLADAYGEAQRFGDEEAMLQCAYRQGHGAAAYRLGIRAKVEEKFLDAIEFYQNGTKFGDTDSAAALEILFLDGAWHDSDEEMKKLSALGIVADPERAARYKEISDTLQINPDLRLSRLDKVLPLPPAKLPKWHGIEEALEPESTAPPTY